MKLKFYSAMDKLHIYRDNTKSFGGQSNRYLSRIGRICGGQIKVSPDRHGEDSLEMNIKSVP